MHIDIIETLPSLAKLEDNWNAVYDADDEAQVFLSWRWLSGWLSYIEDPWFILAAKAGEAADLPYVAFLPLRLQTTIEKADVISDMRMAGNFAPTTPASFADRRRRTRSFPLLPATSGR